MTDGSISISAGRCIVASVHNGVSVGDVLFDREPKVQRANARLIKAAPDLLEVLHALFAGGYFISHVTDTSDDAAMKRKAIATIRKATP